MIDEGGKPMTDFIQLLFSSSNILMKTRLVELMAPISKSGHEYVWEGEGRRGDEGRREILTHVTAW